ncbi:hypothetical protein [Teredinibacter sp. KSP-S5-2]|uniref:hypothetical protein n=1 Tax=Teredinibacter sp. KSP-S5-2 TaxID=3034506 RepID=UPI002934DAA3|nr:hypothetical protein [Teredinibacter sp. KSP-S5-2]WNO10847.1 TROVE domain-containing protein [Teredinibacter sp. KSP-S5-2]
MANKNLFSKIRGIKADSVNEAGGKAYALSNKEALAQYVVTGCLNGTFYATDEKQLQTVIDLANKVDARFLSQLAIYARNHAYMKDSPALLLAVLSMKDTELFKRTFFQVIDNGKMLRNFVQIMRSGVVGRKSLGSAPKKMVAAWLRNKKSEQLLNASVGKSPSLSDVIKMVHPAPVDLEQEALFAYIVNKEYKFENLPRCVKEFERFKSGVASKVPNVDFRLLSGLELDADTWKSIAENGGWQMTRMNLNTFNRQGCFDDKKLTIKMANRLRNKALIEKSKVFPYQLMSAFNAAVDVPKVIRDALQDAMEHALSNVPVLKGKTYVLIDVSGSMQSPVTGYRPGATSTVRCIDVAALFAAALLKTGQDVEIIPFDTQVHRARLNDRDSVFTVAHNLAKYGGGGTACGLPLEELNMCRAKADTVIYFSDNESWADRGYFGGRTKISKEWAVFKKRNPNAKLVLTDLQPYGTSQAKSSHDVLNIGGFSDQVFNVIAQFVDGGGIPNYWEKVISDQVQSA